MHFYLFMCRFNVVDFELALLLDGYRDYDKEIKE